VYGGGGAGGEVRFREVRFELLRTGGGELDDPDVRDDKADDRGGSRIRCPNCAWEPGREAHWACACLHVWNTFETGGICPACQRQWLETQCPKCHVWSPHLAWYVDDAGSGQ
jgi:hypothetical protein